MLTWPVYKFTQTVSLSVFGSISSVELSSDAFFKYVMAQFDAVGDNSSAFSRFHSLNCEATLIVGFHERFINQSDEDKSFCSV